MDKLTKNYIDDIVKPMLNRIQSLQRSNAELQVQVRYLQSLIVGNGTYQKPTISASNHMRDSRISSKGQNSAEKRPGWNSKTKVEQSPTPVNKEPTHHEKLKTKPPIPKLMKSPNKNEGVDEMRSSAVEKKITGGVKYQADNSQKKSAAQSNQNSPVKQEKNVTLPKEGNHESSPGIPLPQSRPKPANSGTVNNSFEQLVKNNTQILASMKDSSLNQRPVALSPSNYVQKANAPKSQYNQSQTTSPNERSFASQANPQEKVTVKPSQGLKINLDGNMAKIDLK